MGRVEGVGRGERGEAYCQRDILEHANVVGVAQCSECEVASLPIYWGKCSKTRLIRVSRRPRRNGIGVYT